MTRRWDRERFIEAMTALKAAVARGECRPTSDEVRAINTIARRYSLGPVFRTRVRRTL